MGFLSGSGGTASLVADTEVVESGAIAAPSTGSIGALSEIGARRLNPRWMLAAVLLVLAAQNMLLWRFLDFAPAWLYALALALFAGVAWFIIRSPAMADWQGPTLRGLLFLAGIAILIFLLGGEGRLFYANADWQVRDAVQHDLTLYPWPYAYNFEGQIELIRAPIGMYLIPAIVGKAFGPKAVDAALLIQNSLLLTLLLGLGSTMFVDTRAKIRALVVVVFFSGMDIIGQLLRSNASGEPLPDHLERWAGSQFSSHITQAFWVPQHALAGWFGALLFLLWRERRISLGQMYAPVPLLMLLSPLGVMGTLPFAAYAGIATVLRRELKAGDVLLPALTTILAAPAILYLGAAGESVGIHLLQMNFVMYLLFEILEVVPFAAGVALINRSNRSELATLLLVGACLVIAPLVQIGEGMDFTMRVSIPALAILAVQVAWSLDRAARSGGDHRPARMMLIVTLLVGSVTGAFEIARALTHYPSPRIHCNLTSAWYRVVDLPKVSTNAAYFARAEALPPMMRPRISFIAETEPGPCWDRRWEVARFTPPKHGAAGCHFRFRHSD